MVSTVILLAQACPSCSNTYFLLSGPAQQLLATLGMLTMIAAFAGYLRLFQNKRIIVFSVTGNDLSDSLVILVALLGCILLTGSATIGIFPCPICILFWTCIAILMVELGLSARKYSSLDLLAMVVGCAASSVVLFSPSLSRTLASYLPRKPYQAGGLPAGTPIPRNSLLPHDGYVAFATRCSRCDGGKLAAAINSYLKQGKPISLATTPVSVKIVAESKLPLLRLSTVEYASLGIRIDGPPVICKIAAGKFVGFRLVEDIWRF